MVNSSESKVTRRDAILTAGKGAVAIGAAALLTGRLPKIQPLNATDDGDDDNEDMQEQPAAGLATVAMTYLGNGDDESLEFTEAFADTDETASHLVDLGLVPLQFVISELVGTTLASGTLAVVGGSNSVFVMTVGPTTFVSWVDQNGAQAILPTPSSPIVVGTSVDVEALEDAINDPPLRKSITLNKSGTTYGLLAFGFPSTAPSQDDDGDGD